MGCCFGRRCWAVVATGAGVVKPGVGRTLYGSRLTGRRRWCFAGTGCALSVVWPQSGGTGTGRCGFRGRSVALAPTGGLGVAVCSGYVVEVAGTAVARAAVVVADETSKTGPVAGTTPAEPESGPVETGQTGALSRNAGAHASKPAVPQSDRLPKSSPSKLGESSPIPSQSRSSRQGVVTGSAVWPVTVCGVWSADALVDRRCDDKGPMGPLLGWLGSLDIGGCQHCRL